MAAFKMTSRRPAQSRSSNQTSKEQDRRMKTIGRQNLIAAALVGALAFTIVQAQQLPTSGIVKSPLGNLELKEFDVTERASFADTYSRRDASEAWRLRQVELEEPIVAEVVDEQLLSNDGHTERKVESLRARRSIARIPGAQLL
jgi:hypothetical protein